MPYGRNFREAGGRSDQCSVKACVNKKKFKSKFKNRQKVAELIRTVCGSEFPESALWAPVAAARRALSSRETGLKIGKHAWKSSEISAVAHL